MWKLVTEDGDRGTKSAWDAIAEGGTCWETNVTKSWEIMRIREVGKNVQFSGSFGDLKYAFQTIIVSPVIGSNLNSVDIL